MATTRKRAPRKRSITSRESEKFLTDFFEKYPFAAANLINHRKVYRTIDTYELTVDKMSNTWYQDLLNQEWVKDIYYNAVVPPPAIGYGISLRYKVYIIYNKITPRTRTRKKKEQ